MRVSERALSDGSGTEQMFNMATNVSAFIANARGLAATAKVLSLDDLRARRGAVESEHPAELWSLESMRGRLVELSARGATATLTAATSLMLEAQTASEPIAWITLQRGTFYPPDLAESGLDLAALVVVRAPDMHAMARAAERVLRSGAFGLVVLDLIEELSTAHQGRLVTLAQAHDAAVVCITDKTSDTASLGSLVSLRAEAMRTRVSTSKTDYELTLRAIKDKRRGPGWMRTIRACGPSGM